MSGGVQVQVDGAVARVTLAHAGKFNAMSRTMWRALQSSFETLQQDTQLRCIVVRGEGEHFCAGGDISEYPGFRFDPPQLQQFHEEDVWGALQAILNCDVPVVAQISGNCMGAGLEIASCCDLRVACTSARFGAPIAHLGFPMAPREAALVAQAVGDTTARAMLLAAQLFDATHMQSCGFLTRVVDDATHALKVAELAQSIAALAPQAARMNKQTFRALNSALALMDTSQAAPKTIAKETPGEPPSQVLSAYLYAPSAEHREGIAAFLEKRKPQF